MAFLVPALPWIAAGASIVGGGVGAYGAIQQGRATQAAAEFNAASMRQQAGREREIAELQAEQFSRAQQRLLATSRAARLASGVTMSGTPLLVDEAAVDEIAYNEALIRAGGEVKATRLNQQADLERFGGRSARISGMFRAGQSLLTAVYGASSALSSRERSPLRDADKLSYGPRG